jgi:Ni,Fe-hydrogenase III large subunit
LMRGVVALGGLKRDVLPQGLDVLRKHLDGFENEFDDLFTSMIDSGTFTDRVDAQNSMPHSTGPQLRDRTHSGLGAGPREIHSTTPRQFRFRSFCRRGRRRQGAADGSSAGGGAIDVHSGGG